MFRKQSEEPAQESKPATTERVTSVLGKGITWKGDLVGSGGVRIESALEGNISLKGLLVIGETGRVTCDHIKAKSIVVAGVVKGDITSEKVEIRSTGRVWGNVVTMSFSTEEGAFLRGKIRMEDKADDLDPNGESENGEGDQAEETTTKDSSEDQ